MEPDKDKVDTSPDLSDEDKLSPQNDVAYTERRRSAVGDEKVNHAARLRNPLVGMSDEDVLADVDLFVEEKGLMQHQDAFRKGALVARHNEREDAFEDINALSEEEKAVLRHEINHKWSQPLALYFLVVLCAGSAIVQGMDQAAVNGAQVFYFDEFGIQGEWMQGLINGAPYLCSAVLGCWSNAPLNKIGGRRFTIFVSCVISVITGIWMAVAQSWPNLLVARFALGFAVGAKSSTTPVYSAECTPKTIRGALTMMWQMWTAFGIMLGGIVSVAFQNVTILGTPGEDGTRQYSPWRWMLGSTAIPPLIVCCQVYFCPESPRWYMEKGKFDKAFNSLSKLRAHDIQAARDMYYAFKLLEIETKEREGKNLWKEFFTIRRNRRAAQSAFWVMFMQQFCAVNVIAYYSTQIFIDAGFSRSNALLTTMGTGITNWLFAIPAIFTIDTFGRRNLLLVTYPLMGICLLWGGFSFLIPAENGEIIYNRSVATLEGDPPEPTAAGLGSIAAAIYAFMVAYSPGEGPVPFTYSAEAFPLYIRDVGMSFATATCWGFNFIISLTWPALSRAFTPTGGMAWYAAWNFIGWVYVYFLLPETKNFTLEELDVVFNVGNKDHAKYYRQKAPWYFKKWTGRKPPPYPTLMETFDEDGVAGGAVDEKSAGKV